MDSPIVTRFAPSPTGRLHLGHALAAWEARSLADRFSGRCVLRMEDIDRTRCRPEFVGGILEDLDWLGIRFDGPMMVQSSRFSAYEHALQALKDRGVLYPCFCTRREIAEEVAAMGGAPQGGRVDVYPGTCRLLDKGRRKELLKSGKPFSWRLDCRAAARITGPLLWRDMRSGDQVCRPEELGDVILGRKDCAASYHIAVVVDDAAQGGPQWEPDHWRHHCAGPRRCEEYINDVSRLNTEPAREAFPGRLFRKIFPVTSGMYQWFML